MGLRAFRYVLWGFCALLAVGGLALWLLGEMRQDVVTSGLGTPAIGGSFEMIDADGEPVTDADLRGKPTAMFFGFTYCPEVCPTTLYELSGLMKELGLDADRLNVVFVSVDPERDTPEAMRAYLSAFDPGVIGLTGTPEQVARIAEAYRVHYMRVPVEGGDYTMSHTASVYLMKADGDFFGTISYEESSDVARAKLERLVETAS